MNIKEEDIRPILESFGHELRLAIRHGIYGAKCNQNDSILSSAGMQLELGDISLSLDEVARGLHAIANAIKSNNKDK